MLSAIIEVCTKGWRPKEEAINSSWEIRQVQGDVKEGMVSFPYDKLKTFSFSVLKSKAILLVYLNCSNCKCYIGQLASFIYV